MIIASLYMAGSTLFIVASLLIHPTLAQFDASSMGAVGGFIVGSVLFSIAGTMGVAYARRSPMLGPAVWSLIGGLLLLAGSVAFIPALDSSQGVVGTYLFRAGSCAYIVSSLWALGQALAERPTKRAECAGLVAYILGATCFLIGGVRMLSHDPALASMAWATGSALFLIGATLPALVAQATRGRGRA